jgi:hypothetical protein
MMTGTVSAFVANNGFRLVEYRKRELDADDTTIEAGRTGRQIERRASSTHYRRPESNCNYGRKRRTFRDLK